MRSNWEKEIDLMLHESGMDYEYESKTFELSKNLTYTPDFIVGNVVIEVKGWPNDISKKRARKFMRNFPNKIYLVIGNRVPCDVFIDWEGRKEFIDVITSLK